MAYKSAYAQQGGGGGDFASQFLKLLLSGETDNEFSENRVEASTMANVVDTVNTKEGFENLAPILEDWARRNNSMGRDIEAVEAVIMPIFHSKREQFGKLEESIINANKFLDPTYYVSAADKSRAVAGDKGAIGGIQNIVPEDVAGWTYKKMAEESNAINNILDGFTAGKNMTFNIKGSKYNRQQLKRYIDDYKSTLDAGLQMAYYSGTIPDDIRIIRAIMAGKINVVEEIRKKETTNQTNFYNQYNREISSLTTLGSKIKSETSGIVNPVEKAQKLLSLISGYSGDADFDKFIKEHPDMMAEMVEVLGSNNLNSEEYLNYIETEIGGKDGFGGLIGSRRTANERYKKYEGVYIEDTEAAMDRELSMMFGRADRGLGPVVPKEVIGPGPWAPEEQDVSGTDTTAVAGTDTTAVAGTEDITDNRKAKIMDEHNLSESEYNELKDKTDFYVSEEFIEREASYKGMKSGISKARMNLFDSHIGAYNALKRLNKLKSLKKAGYEVSNSKFKQAQNDLSNMQSNVLQYKNELKELSEKITKKAPPQTSVAFEKQVRKLAESILKKKNLKATTGNWNKAMEEARDSLRKESLDPWGIRVKRGETKVPFYMTGERMPKP